MNNVEKATLENLRKKGYHVLVFTPEQVNGADEVVLKDSLVEAWWSVIDRIGVDVIPSVHMP